MQGQEDDDTGKIDEDSGRLSGGTAEDNGSNQINKWGFAPGEDDTQDLNMENKGKKILIMLQCIDIAKDTSSIHGGSDQMALVKIGIYIVAWCMSILGDIHIDLPLKFCRNALDIQSNDTV